MPLNYKLSSLCERKHEPNLALWLANWEGKVVPSWPLRIMQSHCVPQEKILHCWSRSPLSKYSAILHYKLSNKIYVLTCFPLFIAVGKQLLRIWPFHMAGPDILWFTELAVWTKIYPLLWYMDHDHGLTTAQGKKPRKGVAGVMLMFKLLQVLGTMFM